jgi:DNA-binding XRE family transcriptional regulator
MWERMACDEVEQRHLELFGHQKVFQAKHIAYWAVQIKQARKARGWTQQDLAQIIGKSSSTIGRIETGSMVPSTETLIRISLSLPITFISGNQPT